jgi:hypothetical protein
MPSDVHRTRQDYLRGRTLRFPTQMITGVAVSVVRSVEDWPAAVIGSRPASTVRASVARLMSAAGNVRKSPAVRARSVLEYAAGVKPGELDDVRLVRLARAATHPDRHGGALDRWREVSAAVQVLQSRTLSVS